MACEGVTTCQVISWRSVCYLQLSQSHNSQHKRFLKDDTLLKYLPPSANGAVPNLYKPLGIDTDKENITKNPGASPSLFTKD